MKSIGLLCMLLTALTIGAAKSSTVGNRLTQNALVENNTVAQASYLADCYDVEAGNSKTAKHRKNDAKVDENILKNTIYYNGSINPENFPDSALTRFFFRELTSVMIIEIKKWLSIECSVALD